MEADLYQQRDGWIDRDRVSARARDLSGRARSLERDIASSNDARNEKSDRPDLSIPNPDER
jgi:hypothetical protein